MNKTPRDHTAGNLGSAAAAPVSGADTDVLRLEAFLPYRLNRLADAVSREFQKIYKARQSLTRPEWRVLASLGQCDTATATEIGLDSAMHKTKVSRAVAELERRGWLRRTASPADRRVEHLELTKAGQRRYRELVPLAKRYETEILDRLGPADQAALAKGLSALEAAFKQR